MKTPALLLLTLCISTTLFSQRNDLLFTNGQLIEADRYENIEHSPYLFNEWVHGDIKPRSDKEAAIEKVLLNYNGYTKRFEARKDKHFIELDESAYSTITIPSKAMVFKTEIHPKLPNRFMRIVYEGKSFTVVQDFVISLQKREKKVYAKVNIISEFIKRPTYYIIKNNQATILKPKKKAILELLDNNKQVATYIKKEGLKMKREQDLVQVLRYYEKDVKGSQFVIK